VNHIDSDKVANPGPVPEPDTPTEPETPPEPGTPTEPESLSDAIRSLGFDPDQVQAVVLTPHRAVAIAADYPEPHITPQEAS